MPHETLRPDWLEPQGGAGGSLGEFGSAADVGGTPLERIRLCIGGVDRVVHLKLEGHNPSGSIKDRAALSMLRNLEASGRLASRGRLVESSSGNLAVALALAGDGSAATAQLLRILRVDPADSSARLRLALIYRDDNRIADARRELQVLIADYPDAAEAATAREALAEL